MDPDFFNMQLAMAMSISENAEHEAELRLQTDNLQALLAAHERELHPASRVRRDGNCLFDCLSLAKYRSLRYSGKMRKDAVQRLRDHPDLSQADGFPLANFNGMFVSLEMVPNIAPFKEKKKNHNQPNKT